MNRYTLCLALCVWAFFSNAQVPQNQSDTATISKMYQTLFQKNTEGRYEEVYTEGEKFLATVTLKDTFQMPYANLLFIIGTGHYNYGNGICLWYTERALTIFNRLKDFRAVDAYNRLAECEFWYTGDMDKAIDYCQKAIETHQKKTKDCTTQLSRVYANLGLIYTQKPDYKQAKIYYEEALNCSNDNQTLGVLHSNFADFYYQQNNYNQALWHYNKSDSLFVLHFKSLDNPNIASVYGNKAKCYLNLGEHNKAISYLSRAKYIFDKKLPPNHINIFSAVSNIGICLVAQKKYEEALPIFEQCKALKLVEGEAAKLSVYYNLALCYAELKQVDTATKILKEFETLLQTTPNLQPIQKVIGLNNIANCYSVSHNYKSSIQYYQNALTLLDSLGLSNDVNTYTAHIGLGYNYFNLKKAEESIAYFQKTIRQLTSPQDKESVNYYYAIYGLSLSYYLKFNQLGDTDDLKQAINLMEESVKYIIDKRKLYAHQSDKQFLNSDGNVCFSDLIGMLLRQNSLNPNPDLWDKCFELAEQSKSAELLESLKSTAMSDTSKVVEQINGLSHNINVFEKNIFQAQKDSNQQNLDYWTAQLFDIRSKHEKLLAQLKKETPQYFSLIYTPQLLNIKDLQQNILASDQTLLQYIISDSSVFMFVVNKNNYTVQEIKKDSLDNWVKQLRSSMYDNQDATGETYIQNAKNYTETAYKLYRKLIAPIKSQLQPNLIIVPDGVLGYIPFEALLTEKPETNFEQYQLHPYLLKDYNISYNYSATLWQEMKTRKITQNTEGGLISFAPTFGSDTTKIILNINTNLLATRSDPLKRLYHNIEEVQAIQKIIGGKVYTGNFATKETFLKEAAKYRMIHLATHGKADDRIGDYAFLAFQETKDSGDNGRLYVKDLYNCTFNADLVVLSACETGIGKWQRGEGIISLARAFAYSGTKSIVTTLWSIDDAGTKTLMASFYQNLKRGLTKDAALRQAKLDYLNTYQSNNAAPFHWAAFIAIGDMQAIKK